MLEFKQQHLYRNSVTAFDLLSNEEIVLIKILFEWYKYNSTHLHRSDTFVLLLKQDLRLVIVPQVREAYLHFMVSIAKITRDDRNLTQDDDRVWEEMMQVLELETDIANVSASHNRKWNCETLEN